ncbi:MAG: DUF262 domain-containing HNH endonuclease family protein [Bacteroidetes bacterium]|jgi:uncharacterized protein with ParB-like and HNH nuclease domain|nr:DUF262 domain-containing HNH endonuclease family protein [Bacteroidota bacterium]
MGVNRFTPANIGGNKFTIPLYQRLFEWEEKQVVQLMQDLYNSFLDNKENPYYIGVLTVFKDKTQNKFSLVDGQQRFTVLMLLGVVLEWEDFLQLSNELRLTFFARKKDEAYLKAKAENVETKDYINVKMDMAIVTIQSFLKKEVEEKNLEGYTKYIKEQTTFFISELPQDYSSIELNRYFEAMNEAGKGLENHEILKVQLLKKLKEEDFDRCTKIWNAVSQMDKCLVRQKEDEIKDRYIKRIFETFEEPHKALEDATTDPQKSELKIRAIKATKEKPKDNARNREEGALLDFQEFLLIVLDITLGEDVSIGFDKNKLLSTFEQLEKQQEKIKPFFDNLLIYRLLFDYCIIRTTSLDGRTTTYTLNYSDNTDQPKQALIHYQSMLYVSTAYNIWLIPLMKKFHEVFINDKLKDFEFLNFQKTWDNERHKGDIRLNYGSINRYWFWRLDYYLWERREEFFKDEAKKKIANQYIFRPNRSIEHVAPQTPKSESTIKLNDDILHKFGNLSMISAGQNSSLKNESYEVKKAHITSFVNGSVGGSIESLKLLKIFESKTWNEAEVKKHHNDMIDILIASFEDKDTKENLEKIKHTDNHA